ARDVAAGTIETGNETEFHGIGASRENDWDSGRCSFGGHCCRRGERNNYGHGVGHQVGGQCWQMGQEPVRWTIFDFEVWTLDITGALEALPNSVDLSIIGGAAEQAD